MTTKKLTSKQMRWAEFLSEFNFIISYQSGKKNKKANTLTRKPYKISTDHKNKQQQYCIYTLLPPEQIKLQSIEEKEAKKLTLPEQVTKLNCEDKLCKEICRF